MRKVIISSVVLMLFAFSAFAANFTPTLLKMSAPPTVQYEFDGSEIEIPVQLTGTAASTLFLVYTYDKASSVNNVVNGYLGWHTVNQIDTCIYNSQPVLLDKGSNNVLWDGKDNDGKVVPKGTYTYYLFGYDSVSTRILAAPVDASNMSRNVEFYTRDINGNPLSKPVVYTADGGPTDSDLTAGNGDAIGWRQRGKWILGSDPQDTGLFETCRWLGYSSISGYVQSPYEQDMFYAFSTTNNLQGRISKWTWVPNGAAEQDTGWGDEGEFVYGINTGAGWWVTLQGMVYVGGDLLAATNTDHSGVSTEAELVMVSALEGEEVFRIDLSQWWVSLEDGEAGGQAASGPNKFDVVGENLFVGAHSSCANNMIVPTAGEDEEDWMRWTNMNGDYTGDHNFEETSERPWVCHDYNVGPYKYQIRADSNLFSVFPCFDMGAVTFGLYAPDGTGLGYHAFAGEASGGKLSTQILDDDTAFDGMYSDYVSSGGSDAPWGGPASIHFTAHDSFKGIISSEEVAVDEAAPAAFAVAQNSPNPFNPTTTIDFNIAEAGNVSIDVFNVAGQKVDTITSGYMSAGAHTATWDASAFSAGVYFYTVKAGNVSKTMKMTLLK